MCDGPLVGKVRSRDPPWYPLTLGMTHVVVALFTPGWQKLSIVAVVVVVALFTPG